MDVIENNQFDLISVYPNPNNGLVNLNLGNLVSAVIKVYGSHGQVVYQQKGVSGIHQFELKSAPGVYFIEVDSEIGKQVFKLVKK